MQTLIYLNPVTYSNSQFPSPIVLFRFPFISRETKSFLPVSRVSQPLYPRRNWDFLPAKASKANYGGWDDLGLGEDSVNPGESTHSVWNFLVSIGIDDRRHVFTFLLGIVTAFTVSRVRISSIIAFPACVLVFAVGFSFGFFRGGSFNGFSENASKRKVKEETMNIYSEKLRALSVFFDGFDAKVDDLKNEVQTAIAKREIGLDDLENYVSAIELMKLLASDARNALEGSANGSGSSNGVVAENQKTSSGKSKAINEVGFNFFQFVGGLFGDSSVNLKSNQVKEKESAKPGTTESLADDQSQGDGLAAPSEKRSVTSADNKNEDSSSRFSQGLGNKSALDWDKDRRHRIGSKNTKMNFKEADMNAKVFSHNEEYSYQNERFRFIDDEYVSWKTGHRNETETGMSNDKLIDYVDFGVSLRHLETETSFVKERMFKKSRSIYRSTCTRMKGEDEASTFQSREGRESDDILWPEDEPMPESEAGSSLSAISEDVMFDRYLTEANDLLKQAKVCMKVRRNEEHAEFVLYKSAKLLVKAITMKPMSLLAVGQLGNTYLLHGELKLRISRELRTVLSRRGSLSVEKQWRILKGLDDQVMNKDKVASALINVCEECEELLVEAGRKYRLALIIDGNDVRALYNWGLALSFRAQLIADIGPEAALDADKVFLAAIDKFDAMMSKGNAYAPDALFRWGVALQQRSRLRPSNSKERVKLLQQARRLYEDVLDMDTDNSQVREALLSCVSELNYRLL